MVFVHRARIVRYGVFDSVSYDTGSDYLNRDASRLCGLLLAM